MCIYSTHFKTQKIQLKPNYIMKKITFIILTFTVLLFNSCSSDDNSSSSDNIFITFKANGETFNFTNPATAGSLNITINDQSGNDDTASDYSFVSIWFPTTIATGTFDFTGSSLSDGDYKLKFESNALNIDSWSESGSVTITSATSDFIEGTFTGEIDGVTITEGEFRAFNL